MFHKTSRYAEPELGRCRAGCSPSASLLPFAFFSPQHVASCTSALSHVTLWDNGPPLLQLLYCWACGRWKKADDKLHTSSTEGWGPTRRECKMRMRDSRAEKWRECQINRVWNRSLSIDRPKRSPFACRAGPKRDEPTSMSRGGGTPCHARPLSSKRPGARRREPHSWHSPRVSARECPLPPAMLPARLTRARRCFASLCAAYKKARLSSVSMSCGERGIMGLCAA